MNQTAPTWPTPPTTPTPAQAHATRGHAPTGGPVPRRRRTAGVVAAALTAAMLLVGCSSGDTGSSGSSGTSGTAASTTAASGTRSVDTPKGRVEVPAQATSIAATDNRIFHTLDAWGVKLSAAPVALMPDDLSYTGDSSVKNIGNHREPNLELLVAAKPDLVLNGQRFSKQYDTIRGLVPDAALVDTDIDSSKPLADELRRQTTLLGEVFDRKADAAALVKDFDDAVTRAKTAYAALGDGEKTVLGAIVSGDNVSYAAPSTGRAVGPLFDMLGLTPALERSGSGNHEGDDISVEAIAQSTPQWMVVMDRDAAVTHNGKKNSWTPADEIIKGSEALRDVPAVTKDRVVYLPDSFYLTEDIQSYTAFLRTLADRFEAAARTSR
ncbi:ABC transporter substrate-binding protein [Corynebacterium bovis]|uniref:siderophore ABC transporter substrate-binding protein n=1 Tax=Corynebacterium bovis TaxID=36808 RepID=UPI00244D2360|nr:ABC transporter substrate-binding protein [Corynebacterium bovis]MDH2456164.1 ABC transporter substrate-binding protein [Corynebacterium bovis]